jgi:hypothetical protein
MAADRLKFRCYRCTQLLAVAPSKAGSIVACPKCKTELLIPSADPGPSVWPKDPAPPEPRSNGPSVPNEPTPFIPPELLDLRPEDIRIEASLFESLETARATEPAPAEERHLSEVLSSPVATSAPSPPLPADAPSPSFPFIDPGPIPDRPSIRPIDRPSPPLRITLPPAIPEPAPVAPANEALPISAIDLDPPTISRPSAEKRTIREVVLPASVVLAWSLFVLFALGIAFIAGLLVGHFLWTPS